MERCAREGACPGIRCRSGRHRQRAMLNAFPPDPLWPQTPERISPGVKSVITIVQHIPAGAFRCRSNTPVQYIDMLVLRKMDKIAYQIAEELEARRPSDLRGSRRKKPSGLTSAPAMADCRRAISASNPAWERSAWRSTSSRPNIGPRIYLTGILTELELAADGPMTEQVCIGESCSRCLHSCPGDAVLHFGIDKRACAQHAQEFGFSTIMKFLDRVVRRAGTGATTDDYRHGAVTGPFRFLAGPAARRRIVRRLPALPRGLPGRQRLSCTPCRIAESHPGKDLREGGARQTAPGGARRGEPIAGLNDWNIRWVGPEGYKGIVARQVQEFKKPQKQRAPRPTTPDRPTRSQSWSKSFASSHRRRDQGQGAGARRRSGRHRRRRGDEPISARSRGSAPADRYHRTRLQARDRARQASQQRRCPHHSLGRSHQILQ